MSYGKLQPGTYLILPAQDVEDLLGQYTVPSPIQAWELTNPNGIGQIFIMESDDKYSLVTTPLHEVVSIESNGRLVIVSEALLKETYLEPEAEFSQYFTLELRQSMSIDDGDEENSVCVGLYSITTVDALDEINESDLHGYVYEDDEDDAYYDDDFSSFED